MQDINLGQSIIQPISGSVSTVIKSKRSLSYREIANAERGIINAVDISPTGEVIEREYDIGIILKCGTEVRYNDPNVKILECPCCKEPIAESSSKPVVCCLGKRVCWDCLQTYVVDEGDQEVIYPVCRTCYDKIGRFFGDDVSQKLRANLALLQGRFTIPKTPDLVDGNGYQEIPKEEAKQLPNGYQQVQQIKPIQQNIKHE